MAYTHNPKYHNPYYRSWRWMKTVCSNENNPGYDKYGAMGITMYWDGKHDYDQFYRWVMKKLGPKPEGTVLGRKDKTGNFEPGNLHWETPTGRSRNCPRQNIRATYRRKTQSLAQWAEDLNISYYTLRRRYNAGWTIKEIVHAYQC
jgi:hypothetical protein